MKMHEVGAVVKYQVFLVSHDESSAPDMPHDANDAQGTLSMNTPKGS